ncbi:hypothetical protein FBU30_010361 [Linnemannia zychae]|nr:hypothetical protein FBU30_010361 [Linnemannia zychae]
MGPVGADDKDERPDAEDNGGLSCWAAVTGTWEDDVGEEIDDEIDVAKEVDDWAEEDGERRVVIEAAAVAVGEWSSVEESSEEERRKSFIESRSLNKHLVYS